MTRPLRRVALVLFVLFGALFVNVNYLQVIRADDLANDNRNTRTLIKEYARQRGSMLVGRGNRQSEIARSVETGGRYKYERRYPDGPLYAHITGFYSIVYGRAGLEESGNRFLVGDAPEQFARTLGDFLSGREPHGDDLVLTVNPSAQEAARDGLGDRTGAVVAIEPSTGAVLAAYANPTYDPNRLSTFDRDEATTYWDRTDDERRNRALRETYPPGSTFKLVTAAAALSDGISADTTFPDPQSYTPPQTTRSIPNFGGGLCNGGSRLTLQRALEVSCNTVFARLGNEVGPEKLVAQAERFGLNARWDTQLPLVPSAIPSDLDPPAAAQSAIGQRDVRVTPLQMAMITAAIANDGVLLRPRVIDRIQDFDGRMVREYGPEPLTLAGAESGAAVSRAVAGDLQRMMVGVVEAGSGRSAAIPGVEVGGKTGTAQVGEGGNPTVWFTGFAPADNPQVAVAVVVPDGGDVGAEATGGAVAAPIAREVMEAVLE
ncbi:MAG: penicillin-binding protein 2 [Nitriliruptorales bacterium]|nr:penicillin-binding protein 2 [Nitriliruptorales bacterium]